MPDRIARPDSAMRGGVGPFFMPFRSNRALVTGCCWEVCICQRETSTFSSSVQRGFHTERYPKDWESPSEPSSRPVAGAPAKRWTAGADNAERRWPITQARKGRSFAAMPADGGGIGNMTEKGNRTDAESQKERMSFLASILVAERMHSEGIITNEEFAELESNLAKGLGVGNTAIIRRN